jgi:hypothetical protein
VLQWVQRINPSSKNEMVWLTSADTTSRRLCMRVYRRFTANHVTSPSQCESNKQQEFAMTAIQHSNLGGSFFLWAGGMSSPPSGNELSTTGARMGPRECSSAWCRQEICISATSPDNLWNAQGITLEGYVTQVGVANPLRMNYTRTFVGNRQGGSFRGTEFYPVSGYRGINNCSSSSADSAGYSYISHSMIAAWTTDAGQFIGAASEVEGGGTTPPPPPPAAQPPAPPVLLP